MLAPGGMHGQYLEWARQENTYWYRSKEAIPGFPQDYGYLANKKWPLIKGNIIITIQHRWIILLKLYNYLFF